METNTAKPIAQAFESVRSANTRGRMPLSQRAKIFVPFDPLNGFQAALREQERLAEERFYEQDFEKRAKGIGYNQDNQDRQNQ